MESALRGFEYEVIWDDLKRLEALDVFQEQQRHHRIVEMFRQWVLLFLPVSLCQVFEFGVGDIHSLEFLPGELRKLLGVAVSNFCVKCELLFALEVEILRNVLGIPEYTLAGIVARLVITSIQEKVLFSDRSHAVQAARFAIDLQARRSMPNHT